MSKKSGLLPLITGLVAGAAAVFFSNEKNRDMAKKQVAKATASAKQLKKKLDEDPDRAIEEVVGALKTKAKTKAKKLQAKIKRVARAAKTEGSSQKKA